MLIIYHLKEKIKMGDLTYSVLLCLKNIIWLFF